VTLFADFVIRNLRRCNIFAFICLCTRSVALGLWLVRWACAGAKQNCCSRKLVESGRLSKTEGGSTIAGSLAHLHLLEFVEGTEPSGFRGSIAIAGQDLSANQR
jgi:hypothetical protein